LLRSWFAVSLLGLLSTFGCRHGHRTCDCCCDGDIVTSCVVLPETPAKPAEVAAVAETPAPAPAPAPKPVTDDTQIQRAAHKVEPAHDVLATVVAPDAGSIGGSIAGTMCLTAADAEAMGIRPGYTPGALFAPAAGPNTLHLTGAHEADSGAKDEAPKAEK
jgi:hypothetical protein